MHVTFDQAKDVINIRKHGISLQRTEDFDFNTARYEVDDSQDYGETRFNAVGFLDAEIYSLTFTEVDNTIRAISLRKASKQEQKKYAEAF